MMHTIQAALSVIATWFTTTLPSTTNHLLDIGWSVLAFLTIVATIGMLAKILKRNKGYTA